MSKQRKLQIDVKGPMEEDPNIIECLLKIDGRNCLFYISKTNYEALNYDGFFDGKSANCENTTSVYVSSK